LFDFNKNWEYFNKFESISPVLELGDMSALTAVCSSQY